MPTYPRSTALNYKLPNTVEYIQRGWLETSQNSAVTSGLLTIVGTLLLFFIINSEALNAAHPDKHNVVSALQIIGYCSIFLNISACMSSFILLDRLGEIPYHASRDVNIPNGGNIVSEQEGILRLYGIGALWKWVVFHWLFCFITGAWSILVQLMIFIWLQESKKTRIGLTVLAVFCVLPFAGFLLAPIVNRWRKDKEDDVESFSYIDSRRDSVIRTTSSGSPIHASPVIVGNTERNRVLSVSSSTPRAVVFQNGV